jgi:hypothetical protein
MDQKQRLLQANDRVDFRTINQRILNVKFSIRIEMKQVGFTTASRLVELILRKRVMLFNLLTDFSGKHFCSSLPTTSLNPQTSWAMWKN